MNNPKTIYYWSPFISKVATIKAVYNSVNSINKYSNNKLSPKIIDVYGEWESYKYFNQKKNNFYSLSSLRFINKFSSLGFIKSRLKYILIFLLCFFPLKKFLSNKKPDFLIIHLITSLPLFLNLLFKFQTKFFLYELPYHHKLKSTTRLKPIWLIQRLCQFSPSLCWAHTAMSGPTLCVGMRPARPPLSALVFFITVNFFKVVQITEW